MLLCNYFEIIGDGDSAKSLLKGEEKLFKTVEDGAYNGRIIFPVVW